MADRTQMLELLIKAKDLASREIRQVNNEVGNLNRNLARGLGGRGGILGGASGAAGLAGRLGAAAFPALTPLITGAQVAFNGLLTVVGWVGDGIKWMVQQAMVALKRLAIGAAAASAAIIGIGVSAVQAASVVQAAEIGFTTMTKSADMAKELVANLQAFAAQTPFQFQSLLQIARPLMAFGFQARQIIPMLRDIGDAIGSLGGGTEGLERVVRAFGQVQAKGRIMMEEVLQFAEAGIPIFDILRTKLGLSEKAMQQLGRQGVSASIAIPAILEGLRERFGGGMAAQMATVAGKASNLADALFNLRAAVGRYLLPLAGIFVDFAAKALGALQPLGEALAQALASPKVIGTVQGWVGQLAEWLGGKVKIAIDWLVTNGPKLGDAMVSGFWRIAGGVQYAWQLLSGMYSWVKTNFPSIVQWIKNVGTTFQNLGVSILQALDPVVQTMGVLVKLMTSAAYRWAGMKAQDAAFTRYDEIQTWIKGERKRISALPRGEREAATAAMGEQARRWYAASKAQQDADWDSAKADRDNTFRAIDYMTALVQSARDRAESVVRDGIRLPTFNMPAMAGTTTTFGPPGDFGGFTGAQMGGAGATVNVTNNFNAPVIGVDDLEERIENGSYRAMRKAAGAGAYIGS